MRYQLGLLLALFAQVVEGGAPPKDLGGAPPKEQSKQQEKIVATPELLFKKGIAFYQSGEFDDANSCFSEAMRSSSLLNVEEILFYKFSIAEQLRLGAKKRLFGYRFLPKWGSGDTLALEIYDEICMVAPSHDLAAFSYFAKGQLYCIRGEHQSSIDELQSLIAKFQDHELLRRAHFFLLHVYREQAKSEPQNPDIVTLAEIAYQNYQRAYPNDAKIEEAAMIVQTIKEFYAKGIIDSALFFEKLNKPTAAALYYQSCTKLFPETKSSLVAQTRLRNIVQKYPSIDLNQL